MLYKNVQAINCSASKCYTSCVEPATQSKVLRGLV